MPAQAKPKSFEAKKNSSLKKILGGWARQPCRGTM